MVTARGEESRQGRRLRSLGRRLRDQAVLAARAEGAHQGGAAPARAGGGAGDRSLPGALKLDPTTHRVTVDGAAVHVGPTEFRLLRFFLARPERVHTRAQLLDQVWGDHVYIEERTVDVHIRRLRLALEPFGAGPPDRNRPGERLPPRRAAMKAVFRKGLVAPAIVGLRHAGRRSRPAGPHWALGVLAAGALGIIVFHLYHIELVTDWAARVPGRPGAGRPRHVGRHVFRDLPTRARCAVPTSAICARSSTASGRRQRPCPTAWWCSTRPPYRVDECAGE